MNFQDLRKQCAACPQTNYEKCKSCRTYAMLNTPCDFCSDIGGVVPLTKASAKGSSCFNVCPKCFQKLI